MANVTRGERLERLLETLAVDQEVFARVAGVPRTTISKASRDGIGWRSVDLIRGIAKACAMSVEKTESYLDGNTPLSEVLLTARPIIDEAKIRAVSARKVELAARNAVKMADIESDMAAPVASVLQAIVDDGRHISAAEMVVEAKSLSDELRAIVSRRRKSYKSEAVPRRRAK